MRPKQQYEEHFDRHKDWRTSHQQGIEDLSKRQEQLTDCEDTARNMYYSTSMQDLALHTSNIGLTSARLLLYFSDLFCDDDWRGAKDKGGILGSPRHSPHLWFILSVPLEDFFAIFVIPSPHLDIHTLTSTRGLVKPSLHLDHHTLTSPRGFVLPQKEQKFNPELYYVPNLSLVRWSLGLVWLGYV